MHTNVSQNASQPGENEPSTGLTAKMLQADSRAPSPQNGRTSPASDDPRSFADVTAGRPATPPAPASDAPTSNSEQTQALSIPEALPDETSFPPLDIAPPTQAPTTETAKSKKAARKQAAKLKKTTNRDTSELVLDLGSLELIEERDALSDVTRLKQFVGLERNCVSPFKGKTEHGNVPGDAEPVPGKTISGGLRELEDVPRGHDGSSQERVS
ncbi:uncharacterized protein C8Q71DRAFT_720402 [Rhodofomes roseus]|uniref:Uncharacterized protein n=1 Tax=Rhodofomes roseus TaxID=34475 RepID=A0ABQ8KVB7_9APHY|nr:uncharacterized protein C8Q71DRAFT_720402 [Rhodofomes roseus]KAH9843020.1 hypothetical protein C8Q71DRAFT_720402 [Rhodofomes roseus]